MVISVSEVMNKRRRKKRDASWMGEGIGTVQVE